MGLSLLNGRGARGDVDGEDVPDVQRRAEPRRVRQAVIISM